MRIGLCTSFYKFFWKLRRSHHSPFLESSLEIKALVALFTDGPGRFDRKSMWKVPLASHTFTRPLFAGRKHGHGYLIPFFHEDVDGGNTNRISFNLEHLVEPRQANGTT